jgi:hypothetical protein
VQKRQAPLAALWYSLEDAAWPSSFSGENTVFINSIRLPVEGAGGVEEEKRFVSDAIRGGHSNK